MIDTIAERDTFGRTALHYAAADGRTDELRRLIAGGADPRDPDGAGFTPLHFAAQEQHADAVEVLVRHGADVAAADRWGNTPLWRAIFTARGARTTIAALLAAGADPDSENGHGISPRRLAETHGTRFC